MDTNEITFENLPKAVARLANEIAEIKSLVEKGQTPEDRCKANISLLIWLLGY